MRKTKLMVLLALVWLGWTSPGSADPARYPELAQRAPSAQPEFIRLEQLVAEIAARKRPLIVDVRSREEFLEGHIKGAVSIPLSEIGRRLAEIPRDRQVVLY